MDMRSAYSALSQSCLFALNSRPSSPTAWLEDNREAVDAGTPFFVPATVYGVSVYVFVRVRMRVFCTNVLREQSHLLLSGRAWRAGLDVDGGGPRLE